jgi:hypothetical protein
MTRPLRVVAVFVVYAVLLPSGVVAQDVHRLQTSQPIRESIAKIDFSAVASTRPSFFLLQTTGRQRSVGRKIAGGVIGGVGGFFAGGYLGAAIDGDCGGCDDPGLLGALIGAPIGAVVGTILGVKFF